MASTHQQQSQAAPLGGPIYWQPMRLCPRGREVHLLGPGLAPTRGVWDGKDRQWLGFQEIPQLPPGGLAALS